MTAVSIQCKSWFNPPSDITPNLGDHLINGGKRTLQILATIGAGAIDGVISIPLVILNVATAGNNKTFKRLSNKFSLSFGCSGAFAFHSALLAVNSAAKFGSKEHQFINFEGDGIVSKYTAGKLREYAKELSTSDNSFHQKVTTRIIYLFNLLIVCPLARAADSVIAVGASLTALATRGKYRNVNHLAYRSAKSPMSILHDINHDLAHLIQPRKAAVFPY